MQDLNLNARAAFFRLPFGLSAAVGAPAPVCLPRGGSGGGVSAVGLRKARDERRAVVQRGGEQGVPGLSGGRGLLARVRMCVGRMWVDHCVWVWVCAWMGGWVGERMWMHMTNAGALSCSAVATWMGGWLAVSANHCV